MNRRSFLSAVGAVLVAPFAAVQALATKKPKLDIEAIVDESVRKLGRERWKNLQAELNSYEMVDLEARIKRLADDAGIPELNHIVTFKGSKRRRQSRA